jgi:hypothetical protein
MKRVSAQCSQVEIGGSLHAGMRQSVYWPLRPTRGPVVKAVREFEYGPGGILRVACVLVSQDGQGSAVLLGPERLIRRQWRLAKTIGLGIGIPVESGFRKGIVARPETNRDHLVRLGFPVRLRAALQGMGAAGEACRDHIKGMPVELYGCLLADETRSVGLKDAGNCA